MLARTRLPIANLSKCVVGQRTLSAMAMPGPCYAQEVRLIPSIRSVVDAVHQRWAQSSAALLENILTGILMIKRTFQPSIIKRKRVHGYLARKATKDGRQVLKRRVMKKRTRLTV